MKSKTFKNLFNSYIKKVPAAIELREIKAGAQTVPSSSKKRAIQIIDTGTWYLSAIGPTPIERERRFLANFLELFTGLKSEDLPLESQLYNRGALVQIGNRIFQEAGMETNFPKRLIAADILPNDHEAIQQLLRHWPELSRIADLEDSYLNKEVYYKRVSCNFLPCTSTNTIVKRDLLKEEDLEKTMQEIKTEGQLIAKQIEILKAERAKANFTMQTHPISHGKPGFFKKAGLLLTALSAASKEIGPKLTID
jgi:hypothetical protein